MTKKAHSDKLNELHQKVAEALLIEVEKVVTDKDGNSRRDPNWMSLALKFLKDNNVVGGELEAYNPMDKLKGVVLPFGKEAITKDLGINAPLRKENYS